MQLLAAGLAVVVVVAADGVATLSVPLISLRPRQSLLARLAWAERLALRRLADRWRVRAELVDLRSLARIYRLAVAVAAARVRLRQQAVVVVGAGVERMPEDLAPLRAAVDSLLAGRPVEPGRLGEVPAPLLTALEEAGVRRLAWRGVLA